MTPRAARPLLVLLAASLASCGSGAGDTPDTADAVAPGTLAYVLSNCSDNTDGTFSGRQQLLVRRNANPPQLIREISIGPLPAQGIGVCVLFGNLRAGVLSQLFGGFQRLGMSPDGTVLVFEVTDDSSVLGASFVAAEDEGIFVAAADGSVRHLAPASRNPATTISSSEPVFSFSPNGRMIVFTDLGPGPHDEEAVQEFTLDVRTGERRQMTHLPPAPFPGIEGTSTGGFLDDRTIVFVTYANPDGLNPREVLSIFTVDVESGELKLISIQPMPGDFVPTFAITGFGRSVGPVHLPGQPVNPRGDADIREVGITDGDNALQLTAFHRVDTSLTSPILSFDGQRVFFTASANPVGANGSKTCQIFSMDALGGDVRQLTHFGGSRHSSAGCFSIRPSEGCRVDFNYDGQESQDRLTQVLTFSSSCDPFGRNPDGEQLFTMRPDGTGLHQLTDALGVIKNADGSVEAELPGPWVYGPYR